MAEQSGKHGPRLDEELRRETDRLVHGGRPNAAPDRDPQAIQTDTGRDPTADHADRRSAPRGMTPGDVDERSAFAALLVGVRYPAEPADLYRQAAEAGAPDVALAELAELPDRPYQRLAEVLDALGIAHEEGRERPADPSLGEGGTR